MATRKCNYPPVRTVVRGQKAVVVAINSDEPVIETTTTQDSTVIFQGIDILTKEIVQRSTLRVPAGVSLRYVRAELGRGYYYLAGAPDVTGGKACTCLAGLAGRECEHCLAPALAV